MATETQSGQAQTAPKQDPIAVWKALSKDKQTEIWGKMSPEQRQKFVTLAKSRIDAEAKPPEKKPEEGFFQKMAGESRKASQEDMYKALGPESKGRSLLNRHYHAGKAAVESILAVGHSMAGGLTDPKNLAVLATGAVDPALPAAYFMTQATGALTGLTPGVKAGDKSPENVEAALLQGATVAGGAGAAQTPKSGAALNPRQVLAQASDKARVYIQNTMNVGQRATAKAEMARAAKIETVDRLNTSLAARHQERVARINQLNKEKTAGYQEKVAEIRRQNEADVSDYTKTVQKLTALNDARKSQVAERVQLSSDVTEAGTKLATDLKDLEQNVRAQGAEKFDQIRELTQGIEGDPNNIAKTINAAKEKYLSTPEEQRLFERIVGEAAQESELESIAKNLGYKSVQQAISKVGEQTFMGYADAEAKSGSVVGGKPMFYEDLHGFYRQFGRTMGTRELPGPVNAALAMTRDAIGKEMGTIAEKAGPEAAALNTEARAYWRDYEQSFHDMRSPAVGGSPLARSYRALDPDYAIAPFVGKSGLRAIETLNRWDPQLAQLARESVAKYRQMQELPKTVVERPLPQAPRLKSIPKEPTPKTTPKLYLKKYPGQIDPEAIKQKGIEKIADKARGESGWGLYSDLGAIAGALGTFYHGTPEYAAGLLAYPLGRRALGSALTQPKILQWLSKATPEEFGARTAPGPSQVAQARGGQAMQVGRVIDNLKEAAKKDPRAARALKSVQKYESQADELGRRPNVSVTNVKTVALAEEVRNLEQRYKREHEVRDLNWMKTYSEYIQKKEKLDVMTGAASGYALWPSEYQSGPGATPKGGGGANYTPEDLDALKKKYGIQ